MINTKGAIGDISPELRETIMFLDSGKVTGSYSQKLSDAVEAIKANEEVRLDFMHYQLWEGMKIRQGVEIGRYANTIRIIRGQLTSENPLPLNTLADIIDTPVDQVNVITNMIKAHPDWDDEDIAEELLEAG